MTSRASAEYYLSRVIEGDEYVSEQSVSLNSASVALSLPTGANVVKVRAMGGDVYLSINVDASADSGIAIPENYIDIIGPIRNLHSLQVYGVSPAKAHVTFYRSK
jgi:hypothetical protein